jgi:hypothetical protein
VLHDLPTGAMDRLGEFLDVVAESGTEVVQEFPDHCVPLRRGEVRGPIHHLVTVADAVGAGDGARPGARPTGRRRG